MGATSIFLQDNIEICCFQWQLPPLTLTMGLLSTISVTSS
ncbi:hypothetical protein Patl1_37182 [Pistacia atlantica]|nr:hypothetical protein Patl1_37182 [Pistacia atlantica]